jgi:hypothetical protein
VRTYTTGATRDVDADKLDYRGFTSFPAWRRFAEYMHRHRVQADGKMRSADNWKKGIPVPDYLTSLTRHFVDFQLAEESGDREAAMELACAIWFNLQGYVHERLKEQP